MAEAFRHCLMSRLGAAARLQPPGRGGECFLKGRAAGANRISTERWDLVYISGRRFQLQSSRSV